MKYKFLMTLVAIILLFIPLSCAQQQEPQIEASEPEPAQYQMSVNDMTTLLQKRFPKAQLLLLDKRYYYTTTKRWEEIFDDVLLNMPERAADRFDCENLAFLTSSRVNERYQLNTCAVAIGMGWSHTFVVFIADGEVYILDPETGEVDPTYTVEFLIMG